MKNPSGIEVNMFFETSIDSKVSSWHARGKKLEFVRSRFEKESIETEDMVVVTFLHFTPDHDEHGSEFVFHEIMEVWLWRSFERLSMVLFWDCDSSEDTEIERRLTVR